MATLRAALQAFGAIELAHGGRTLRLPRAHVVRLPRLAVDGVATTPSLRRVALNSKTLLRRRLADEPAALRSVAAAAERDAAAAFALAALRLADADAAAAAAANETAIGDADVDAADENVSDALRTLERLFADESDDDTPAAAAIDALFVPRDDAAEGLLVGATPAEHARLVLAWRLATGERASLFAVQHSRRVAPAGVAAHPLAAQLTGVLDESERELLAPSIEAARSSADVGQALSLAELMRQQERLDEAGEFYAIASRGGSADASLMLGAMHRHGIGGRAKSDDEALRYFSLAADQGSTQAMGLASTLLLALGRRDDAERMLRRLVAASPDNETALLQLGVVVAEREEDERRGERESVVFLRRAAARGSTRAAQLLDRIAAEDAKRRES